MSREEYFLRVITAVLPGVLSRNNPSPEGAASTAIMYAKKLMDAAEVEEALAKLEEQAQPKRVHSDPPAKPGPSKRG
jgi:hypothetical protein